MRYSLDDPDHKIHGRLITAQNIQIRHDVCVGFEDIIMDINILARVHPESLHIITDNQTEPKLEIESQWVFLGGERQSHWMMVER